MRAVLRPSGGISLSRARPISHRHGGSMRFAGPQARVSVPRSLVPMRRTFVSCSRASQTDPKPTSEGTTPHLPKAATSAEEAPPEGEPSEDVLDFFEREYLKAASEVAESADALEAAAKGAAAAEGAAEGAEASASASAEAQAVPERPMLFEEMERAEEELEKLRRQVDSNVTAEDLRVPEGGPELLDYEWEEDEDEDEEAEVKVGEAVDEERVERFVRRVSKESAAFQAQLAQEKPWATQFDDPEKYYTGEELQQRIDELMPPEDQFNHLAQPEAEYYMEYDDPIPKPDPEWFKAEWGPTWEELKESFIPAMFLKMERFKRQNFLAYRVLGMDFGSQWYNVRKNALLIDRWLHGKSLSMTSSAWWTIHWAVSFLAGRRAPRMYLDFADKNGDNMYAVPFHSRIFTKGLHFELGARAQYAAILPRITRESPIDVLRIPVYIEVNRGWDIAFLWFHLGWAKILGFPGGSHLFYWGFNFPLPAFGISRIINGMFSRYVHGLPHGFSRRQLKHEMRAELKADRFPLAPFMEEDSPEMALNWGKVGKALADLPEPPKQREKVTISKEYRTPISKYAPFWPSTVSTTWPPQGFGEPPVPYWYTNPEVLNKVLPPVPPAPASIPSLVDEELTVKFETLKELVDKRRAKAGLPSLDDEVFERFAAFHGISTAKEGEEDDERETEQERRERERDEREERKREERAQQAIDELPDNMPRPDQRRPYGLPPL